MSSQEGSSLRKRSWLGLLLRRLRIPALLLLGILIIWTMFAAYRYLPGSGEVNRTPDATPTRQAIQPQPSRQGYEYRLMEERYETMQPDGHLDVQYRRRESWAAPDGWAWARQTGIDPAQLLLAPSVDWKTVQDVNPTAEDVNRALHKIGGSSTSTSAERSQIAFNFVSDLLGTETLPASSLPIDYRRALVAALALNPGVTIKKLNPGVTIKKGVTDPIGRPCATQLTLTSEHFTISLFLDEDLRFLAYTGEGDNRERAFKTIRNQHHVGRIPDELLAQLGAKRVERVIAQ